FIGRRSDARRLMAGMDLGIHPSQREVGYCLAILEMMDARLPLIVPDLPSVSGATRNEITGLLYRDGSVEEATRCLRRLALDASLRHHLGEAASQDVATRYSLERSNEAIRAHLVPHL